MNLLADEGVDRQIVERLRQDGHEVLYIAEMAPSIADEAVLDRANTLQAVLLTADKDFGELVFRQGRIHAGVVLIRLAGTVAETKADIVSAAIRDHSVKLADAFSVVTRGTVRIRHQL
jgi:predicted nuclease of predicted toxin-antitoxin system